MSGRIKMARAGYSGRAGRMARAMPGTGYSGDPGLFGFLGKVGGALAGAATGLLPGGGFVRGIAKTALGKVLGGKAKGRTSFQKLQQYQALASAGQANPRQLRELSQAGMGGTVGQGFGGAVQKTTTDRWQVNGQLGPKGGPAPAAGIACPAGYHPNKTGYWIQSPMGTPSYVTPGERCVKARRRNPLNPRAWDRAYSRLKSAKRWQKKMGTITFRETCK